MWYMVLFFSAFCLAFSGFFLFMLAMPKHYYELFHGYLSLHSRVLLRIVGSMAFLGSVIFSVIGSGWQVGLLLWLGWTTIAGAVLVFIKGYIKS
ncbi:DUF3325 domain-containing protein [Pseudomonas aeruginosa]|uniref:DUF3325 domain-containing protein n=1 Tax=Pseudomonas aeruginosa TaxID=287 RepID=UPI0034D3015D